MLFIDNKYTHWYYQIIDRAKSRILTDYTEKHHIIPKSLGGQNNKDNLVKLTPREHFICHLLLPKMLIGLSKRKMTFALTNFTNRSRHGTIQIYKMSSRTYQTIKIKAAKYMSDIQTGKVSNFKGKSHSGQNKKVIGLANSKSCISPIGEVFESTRLAGEAYNLTSAAIRNRIKQIGDWKYIDPEHQRLAETKRISKQPRCWPKGYKQSSEHIRKRTDSRLKNKSNDN